MAIEWDSPRALQKRAREITRQLEDLRVQIHDLHGWIDLQEATETGERATRQV